VINLPSFYMDMSWAKNGRDDFKSTTRDVARLLKQFNAQKVDAVVIDLRRNGGGSLTESINLTGLFIDTGPVVQVKDFDGQKTQYEDTERGVAWAGPLVVLTSKYSASASEIFAGAIQDYKRGLIVGDSSTHGKGTVQSLLDLGQKIFRGLANAPPMGALKITMQQFYRPDGDSTQNRGVLSDVELPSLRSQYENLGEASLDYAMKFDHVEPVPYRKYNLVDNRVIEQLKMASAERRKDSKDFQKVLREIDRYNEHKKNKRISLNKEKFLAQKTEMTAEKEEEQEIEELNDPERPVVKRDFYFNEVLAITTDYVRMLAAPQAASIGQR
jgi:carboxyl-terminal processing protease